MKSQLMIIATAAIIFAILLFKPFYFKKYINPIENFRNELKYLFNYPEKIPKFAEIFENIFYTNISIAFCNGTNYYNYSSIVYRCNEVFDVYLKHCNVRMVSIVYIPFLNFKKPTICYCIKYKNLTDYRCV